VPGDELVGDPLLGREPAHETRRPAEDSGQLLVAWHRWQNQYGGMKADDAKELK
jgi:hypothetical protein